MTALRDQIEALWQRLEASGQVTALFRSLRVPRAGHFGVHAALRTVDGARSLLFDISNGAVCDVEFEVRGMRLSRAAQGTAQVLALTLEEAAHADLFATICVDLVTTVEQADPRMGLHLVIDRLEAWRAFLRASQRMSRREQIGMLGELFVLRELLQRDSRLLDVWTAPDAALHDFEHAGHALEIKTVCGPGSHLTISSVDQLDSSGLDRLDLLHVRVFETPIGSTIEDLVQVIGSQLPDEDRRRRFQNALLRRGIAPDDTLALHGIRVAVYQITPFRIDDAFPRVARSTLPPAVVDVSYILDTARLDPAPENAGQLFDLFMARSLYE